MSKFGIFMLGIGVGVAVTAIFSKKGREIMEQTMVLREPTIEKQVSKFTLDQEREYPLFGFTSDSSLTVDKFLAMTREDKELEL